MRKTFFKNYRKIARAALLLLAALAITAISLAASCTFYRARGIDSSFLGDCKIALTPWKTYDGNIAGERVSGTYTIKTVSNGDVYYCFYGSDGEIAFNALLSGDELVIDKAYFVKMKL